jgi:hypothetical protein
MWWGQASDGEEWRKLIMEAEISWFVELMVVMIVEYLGRNEENHKLTQQCHF